MQRCPQQTQFDEGMIGCKTAAASTSASGSTGNGGKDRCRRRGCHGDIQECIGHQPRGTQGPRHAHCHGVRLSSLDVTFVCSQ